MSMSDQTSLGHVLGNFIFVTVEIAASRLPTSMGETLSLSLGKVQRCVCVCLLIPFIKCAVSENRK